jgi:molybdate transport system ATP-binding protein
MGELLSVAIEVASKDARPRVQARFEVRGVTALCGPSGAGKSSCLKAIAGLLRPDRGAVRLGSVTLFDHEQKIDVPTHRRRVGVVFQGLALFPHLSALENVLFGAPPGLSRARAREHALSWLARMQVVDLADRPAGRLSGGEGQRVALARALAAEPRALLLDEPFSALDAALRAGLREELRAIVGAMGLPTILVTHDEEDARSLATQVIRLQGGVMVRG